VTSHNPDPAGARLAEVLAEMPEVRLAFLFGSRASGRSRRESDFDIAVLVDEKTAGDDRGQTIRHLASRLGREVSSALIDLVILNAAPALLRHRVLRDGILLFQRTPEDRVRFAIKAIRDCQDGFSRREYFTRRRIENLKARKVDGRSRDLLEKARSAGRLLGKAKSVS
jgi:predicted nucleotidyltransferase